VRKRAANQPAIDERLEAAPHRLSTAAAQTKLEYQIDHPQAAAADPQYLNQALLDGRQIRPSSLGCGLGISRTLCGPDAWKRD
jgi:hypothetical protein